MDLGLQGLRALVTGGTRGIGRAIVEVLAAEGAAVGFCARTKPDVTNTVSMMGTVGLVKAALPYLEQSAAASILTIASVSGREIDFAAGPYGVVKAAIIHYTQGLAHQLAPRGIRANSLSPGNTYFSGGVWENIEQHNPELFAQAMALNPTGRMARPAEIARAAAFLVSPAASFITGTNLLVDGALTRGVQF